MNADTIRSVLSGAEAPELALQFLSNEFIPAVVNRLNEPRTRRRMALYGGDRIPENERNLTDVRNRMSLLIEYKLAWIGNDLMEDHGITDLFWTNVVANRFPDLEIRDEQGLRGLRIEVKCLQAVAEEKAANFDTLKKDLNPSTDYVVVFIWDWFKDVAAISWDRAPKVLRAFVFHASALAELRDYAWLQNPPNGLGDGVQGYDLRYAVNCRNGQYNEEEGNYGKLMRIWDSELQYQPGLTGLLRAALNTYFAFEDFTIWSGFDVLARLLLGKSEIAPVEPIKDGAVTVGYKLGKLGFILKRRADKSSKQQALALACDLENVVVMNDKYQWWHYEVSNGALALIEQGKKPKHLLLRLLGN